MPAYSRDCTPLLKLKRSTSNNNRAQPRRKTSVSRTLETQLEAGPCCIGVGASLYDKVGSAEMVVRPKR